MVYGEVRVMLETSYLKNMTEEIIESENRDERRELLYQLLKDLNSAIKSRETEVYFTYSETSGEDTY